MEILLMSTIPLLVQLPLLVLIVLVLRYRRARAEMRYQLLLKLAEAGAALPTTLPGEANPQPDDRRRALVLLAGGLGLSATLLVLPLNIHFGRPIADLWGLGILPIALGLGYLANWALTRPRG
jgi:hypothetical protein